MLILIWKYTVFSQDFNVELPSDEGILIARFMASLWMHTFMEVEERQGLFMMKYAINHHENFENHYIAFFFGMITTTMDYFLEILVIIILTSKT